MTYDLILIGNTILDEVYTVPKWASEGTSNTFRSYRKSIGGLGNILKALPLDQLNILVETQLGNDEDGEFIKKYFKDKSINANIHFSDLPTSKALILSNLDKSERTSFVNWGCAQSQFNPAFNETKWAHISYLDTLCDFDIEGIRKQASILTADLCLSGGDFFPLRNIGKKLIHLDYLFVSDTEYYNYFGTIIDHCLDVSKYCKIKCIVRHSQKKTTFYWIDKAEEEIKNPFEILKNKDVLGAGDYYTAGFIAHCLLKEHSPTEAALSAHKTAGDLIL